MTSVEGPVVIVRRNVALRFYLTLNITLQGKFHQPASYRKRAWDCTLRSHPAGLRFGDWMGKLRLGSGRRQIPLREEVTPGLPREATGMHRVSQLHLIPKR